MNILNLNGVIGKLIGKKLIMILMSLVKQKEVNVVYNGANFWKALIEGLKLKREKK